MKLKVVIITVILLVFGLKTEASNRNEIDQLLPDSIQQVDSIPVKKKGKRFKAILFTVLTGPLGGHRIYLDTKPAVPIVYAVTLGGVGILPLVDLGHLIFSRDISRFENDNRVIMWSK